jgi:hypothetical protein
VINLFSNVALKVLLVVSIVLQSLTAVASATNENHQIDVEHIQVKHDHNSDHSESGKLVDAEGHDVNDCHHCGHCSASHSVWMIVKNAVKIFSINSFESSLYLVKHPSKYIETTFRPPISYLT